MGRCLLTLRTAVPGGWGGGAEGRRNEWVKTLSITHPPCIMERKEEMALTRKAFTVEGAGVACHGGTCRYPERKALTEGKRPERPKTAEVMDRPSPREGGALGIPTEGGSPCLMEAARGAPGAKHDKIG